MNSSVSYTFKIVFAATILLFFSRAHTFGEADYIPGEILVKFRDTSPARSVSIHNLHASVGSSQKRQFKKLNIHHMKLPAGLSVDKAMQMYRKDPNVEYAEPNYIVRIAAVPNDPAFGNLWGLDNGSDTDIDAPEAWELTTGSPGVIVAVVDSGVAYTHPDLSANMWTNTGESSVSCIDGIDNDGNGFVDDCNGWDFVSDDNDPADYHGHGTHVAGTIAAVGNNSTGLTGVLWSAQIMPLRSLGITGTGSTADAVAAILYANANGADVINNSWGGGVTARRLRTPSTRRLQWSYVQPEMTVTTAILHHTIRQASQARTS